MCEWGMVDVCSLEPFVVVVVVVFFFYCYGDHRDLHRVDLRQRQMCIRDRASTVMSLRRASSGLIQGWKSSGSKLGKVSSRLVTVSYTHLRAHETVLDLVCRLLLEKKIS